MLRRLGAAGRDQRGMTLIELLVVMLVIALLVAIALPAYQRSQRQARDARRSEDVRHIQTALLGYLAERGSLPVTASYGEENPGLYDTSAVGDWLPWLAAYSGDPVPKDPVDNETGDPWTGSRFTYWYFCYVPGHFYSPDPSRPVAQLGYRAEASHEKRVVNFAVDACAG